MHIAVLPFILSHASLYPGLHRAIFFVRFRRWAFIVFCIALSVASLQAPYAFSADRTDNIHKPAAQTAGAHIEHTLTIGSHSIVAEIAATPASRSKGLMFRQHLKPNEGMLFVFNKNDMHCFWMKNTVIPLSIAFIDEHGVIINIDEMQAQTTYRHCPTHPIRYALEMNKGWFSKRGIIPGNTVDIPMPSCR